MKNEEFTETESEISSTFKNKKLKTENFPPNEKSLVNENAVKDAIDLN